MNKKTVVIHSGGMDSSISLALAIREFGEDAVLSLSFSYGQRNVSELQQAALICRQWGVEHMIVNLECLPALTSNALTDKSIQIRHETGKPPNTLVVGRNGLMARLGAIHAHHLGARCIYMGIISRDGSNPGYRDCSRAYMDAEQQILRIDLDDPLFEIRTPLVDMTKLETMYLAQSLGVLDFLLRETITCYEGLPREGCQICPSCKLRNEAVHLFQKV